MPVEIPLPQLETGEFDFRPVPPTSANWESRLAVPSRATNLLDWTAKNRKNLGPGRPFDLENHTYLREIYASQAKQIVLMKASQMGASEWLVSYAVHACDQRLANVLYVFPTENHVSDFSTARLGPAIEASRYLSRIVVDGSSRDGLRGSDRITLKRIRNRFLYFRGSKVQPNGSAPQLKSIDADVLILDELDEEDPRAPAIAYKRLGHARRDLGNILKVSTPTYPGMGIHAEWNESDQRYWHIKCDACGERQPLEIGMCVTEWDSLGRPYQWHGKEEGTAWLACIRCGKPLNRLQEGEWVAAHPDRSIAGYHLSKLFSAQMDLLEVVYNLNTADDTKRREAFNQDLGLPYIPRGGHLETSHIDACRRAYGHGPDYRYNCYMGVDVGRVLHVVIRTGENPETGESKQLYAGESDWEGIERLMAIYRPRIAVVDALPETTKAQEFQQKYERNRVWIAYYPNMPQGTKKEKFMAFDSKERKVLIDRTRSLDATFAGFYSGQRTLPAHARNIKDFYDHLRSPIRVLKEDTSGQEVSRYIDTGPDHFAHAENYCTIAQQCRIGVGWAEGSAA